MPTTKIVSVILFLALMANGALGRISLTKKLNAAKSSRLRSYIRRLSLKNSNKHKSRVTLPNKPDPTEIKQKKHFEVMRDFLSGSSQLNFRRKLEHLKNKYGQNLKLSQSKTQNTQRSNLNAYRQTGAMEPSKSRKLQESMIEDELIDFEPSKGSLDLDGHENALSNVRTINSWVSDLETSLDDLREGLNDKLMNMATGLQKRRMILGHFNQVLRNNKPNGRI